MSNTSPPEEIQGKLDRLVDGFYGSACGCMGPQGDQPVCPCAMSSVIQWRGQWIQLSVIKPKVADDYLSSLKPREPLNPKRFPG